MARTRAVTIEEHASRRTHNALLALFGGVLVAVAATAAMLGAGIAG